ncbi:MAG: carboxylating nicotinate-nucleotide diphosphorylase [Bdellovibrionaceae bacterium]|nr:carboxylating nicotinate-nucleotide diphosphorylase [Pseudobdellovibrionaceae bacterium]MBX3032327.1 carboxylating nicotinate-nucleotide diphosphorylase [Pseudobdellovibrionaceae bacterium]
MTLLDLIRAALKEDMPKGDVTTESLALKPRPGLARLKAKEDIALSGTMPFEQTVHVLEPGAKVSWHFEEGDAVLKNQIICTIEGDLVQVLKAERVALNFLGHLSGIATHTRRFVQAVAGTQTRILDTRKTTPGLRDLEKRAVVHGGGMNHRMNLSTAVLIKDNHISVMGGIAPAVGRVREHTSLPIEVEAKNLDEVREAVSLRVQRILLDNMNDETLKQAVMLIPDSIEVEASGNMSLDRVRRVAETGVDYISVGALTHSAPVADVSLLFDWS